MVSLRYVAVAVFVFAASQAARIPKPEEGAKMARYIVHNSDWASVGSISTLDAIKGYPFVGMKDLADGPVENGTGVPYMYVTDIDVTMQDINIFNEVTLFVSTAETDYCRQQNYDQEDPRCVRAMLTGSFVKLDINSEEGTFAKNALFSRHPQMQYWPVDHDFYIVKLNIIQVAVIDDDGILFVSADEYYAANDF